jgi:gas vesicle structural protein
LVVQQAPIQRVSASTSIVDILDRVLDKGIVIVGIDLVTIEAQAVVASVETYQQHSDPKMNRRRRAA